MIKGFMESTLAQSEVFKGLDSELKVKDKAIKLIQTARTLTKEDIEAAYIQVRQITDTLTSEAVKAFENEDTVLIYNNVQKLSLTQAVPFITFNRKGKYITYVFVDKYISISQRDGVLSIQPSTLRDLLTAAVISSGLKRNYDVLASNQYMQKTCTMIYNQFFTRIINREFAIAADKTVYEQLQYYVNRFFLERVFGANNTPENIDTMAKFHIKTLDEIIISDLKKKYDDADPSCVSELLEMFHDLTPRMSGANFGKFQNDWINYYHNPSMLAIDTMEYFLFMVLVLLSGNGNILNISAADIVKETKGIKSFRGELLKIVKGGE